MIAFLTLCYAGLVLLLVKVRMLSWNRMTQIVSAAVYCVALVALVIAMNLYQPYSSAATLVSRVTPLVPEVGGRIVEIPIAPNQPVKAGAVLFRIDPAPYEAAVAELEARLAEAEQAVPQLKAAWDQAQATVARTAATRDMTRIQRDKEAELFARNAASSLERDLTQLGYDEAVAALDEATAAARRAKLAYESQINGTHTTVAQIRAQLDRARIDLANCNVYAPADGYVTQLFAHEGMVTATVNAGAVMTFVYDTPPTLVATFAPNAQRYIAPGHPVEIALAALPGQLLTGQVVEVLPVTGEGQLTPDAALVASTQWAQAGGLLVRIAIDPDPFENHAAPEGSPPDHPLHSNLPPAGTGGSVTIYTDRGQAIAIVRKVMIRMESWMNYL